MSESTMADKHPGLCLKINKFSEGVERVVYYEPGGYHPVHLGDQFQGQYQYRVVHKLGYGGLATVWLCRVLGEKPRYVAVKILMARLSGDDCPELHGVKLLRDAGLTEENHKGLFCLPIDQFQIEGPNGSHLCFVYSVAGPSVYHVPQIFDDPDRMLRRFALQAARTLAILHEHGICHGDLTPLNILLRMSNMDGLPESEIIKILGEPRTTEVFTTSGEPLDPTAPKYLIYSPDFRGVDRKFLTDNICMIDFGGSFKASEPPKNLGIPDNYCSPELIFEQKAGIGSNLWALGCTLFAIRTGRMLFATVFGNLDIQLGLVVRWFGKFPRRWWDAWEKSTSASEMWPKPTECFSIEEQEDFFTENHAEVQNPQSSLLQNHVACGYHYEAPRQIR